MTLLSKGPKANTHVNIMKNRQKNMTLRLFIVWEIITIQ